MSDAERRVTEGCIISSTAAKAGMTFVKISSGYVTSATTASTMPIMTRQSLSIVAKREGKTAEEVAQAIGVVL